MPCGRGWGAPRGGDVRCSPEFGVPAVRCTTRGGLGFKATRRAQGRWRRAHRDELAGDEVGRRRTATGRGEERRPRRAGKLDAIKRNGEPQGSNRVRDKRPGTHRGDRDDGDDARRHRAEELAGARGAKGIRRVKGPEAARVRCGRSRGASGAGNWGEGAPAAANCGGGFRWFGGAELG